MNTSVDKSSKKRKSLGGQKNPPAKAAKLNESMQSPKKENKAKGIPVKSITIIKSPKKQIKPENGISKTEGPKSQGVSDVKKSKNLDNKKKSKGEKGKNQAKKLYIIEKMQKRAETEGKEVIIKILNEKIDAIISKPEVTKTGKKNLRLYKLMVKMISGEESTKVLPQKPKKDNKNKKQVAATVPKEVKAKEDKKNQKPVQKVEQKKETEAKQNKKNKQPVKKVEEEEEEEEESSDDLETSVKSTENEEDSDDAEEEDSDDEEVSGEEAEGSDDEDDDDDEEEEDDDDDEEEDDEEEKPVKKVGPKKVKENKEGKQKPNENGQQVEKKKRYVLFIGNIAYDTTKEELTEHFKKVGEVVDVRIPTDRESNRPRGFAYVELKDEAAYQKSSDLNGSQLKNRQIKVEHSDNEDRMNKFQGQGSPYNGQSRGGFRGNSRGGFRGNSRGSFRGQSRGSFRGQSRGGFRGQSRGGFRGRNQE